MEFVLITSNESILSRNDSPNAQRTEDKPDRNTPSGDGYIIQLHESKK